MKQTLFLPTIITHPDDFKLFHLIIPHAIKKNPTPENIKILDSKEIEDNELSDVLKNCVADSIEEIGGLDFDYSENTSYHLYQIDIESAQDQRFTKHLWLESGLAGIFKELTIIHSAYFAYQINGGTSFRILNYGKLESGYFDDTDTEDCEELTGLQNRATNFRDKWYKGDTV